MDYGDLTKWIPFTQYLRPDGRRSQVFSPMPDGYEDKVAAILAAGCRFESEVLMTGVVSLTVSNGVEDITGVLSDNGPEIFEATKRLIDAAHGIVVRGGAAT